MKKLAALILVLAAFGTAYYFILDGSLPSRSDFTLDITKIRELADAPADQLPSAVHTEILAATPVPSFALRAGAWGGDSIMMRTVFQIVTPQGDYVLEAGMDRAVAEKFNQADNFDEVVWDNIQKLMSGAAGIIVTHEHPDHISGIVLHRDPNSLANKLRLTTAQKAGLQRYAVNGELPSEIGAVEPIPSDGLYRVAPGIVMIPAPGHTPGSVIYFIKTQEHEYLFVGDIAYTESNVVDGVDRTRLMRLFMVDPEIREAVVHQLKAVHELSKTEPDLHIVPAHADILLRRMMDEEILRKGFVFDTAG